MPGPAADDITVPIILLVARTIWFGSSLLKLEEAGCRLSPAQRRNLALYRAGPPRSSHSGHRIAALTRLRLLAILRARWAHLTSAERAYQLAVIVPETLRGLAYNRANMRNRLP